MRLVYVGDPMCSWCYGFGKELSEVLSAEPNLPLQIVVGGLRAGGTEVLDAAGKQFRLSHWARVEAASGLPFNREALMARKDFIYDTEPICRAVVVARTLAPEAPLLDVFRALQHAFYVDGLDTTDPETLARVTAQSLTAAGHPTSTEVALRQYQSLTTIQETRDDFRKARALGINSFPALLMEVDGEHFPVTPGYSSAAEILSNMQALRERLGARSVTS
ncbi:MAG: DsbA family protein [Paucibacter sp.]|nr:DsbA family protein [Roseateles sp.]